MSGDAENESLNPPPPRGQYEFDREQNALLGDLGSKMQFVGMFAIVIGSLVLVGGVLAANSEAFNPGAFISGLLYIAIGAWTRSAGASFRDVVTTKGADITHLIEALGDVRRVYTLFYWICIFAIALLVISLLVMLYWTSFHAAPQVAVIESANLVGASDGSVGIGTQI